MQSDIAIIGCDDGVMDDIPDMTVAGLGCYFGDGQVRFLCTGGSDIGALLISAARTIVDTRLIEVAASIDICLRDSMCSGAVHRSPWSQRGTVGRCTGETRSVWIGHRYRSESGVAIVGRHDGVVNNIPDM